LLPGCAALEAEILDSRLSMKTHCRTIAFEGPIVEYDIRRSIRGSSTSFATTAKGPMGRIVPIPTPAYPIKGLTIRGQSEQKEEEQGRGSA
jgi:hypothetical protein